MSGEKSPRRVDGMTIDEWHAARAQPAPPTPKKHGDLPLTNERRHVFADLDGLDLIVDYDVDGAFFRFTFNDQTAMLGLVTARNLATSVLIHLGRARDDIRLDP